MKPNMIIAAKEKKHEKSNWATTLVLRKPLINDWERITADGQAVDVRQALSVTTRELYQPARQTRQLQILSTLYRFPCPRRDIRSHPYR